MKELESLFPILRQAGITNTEDAINFADHYMGGSLRNILMQLSNILEDNIRLWQFKNQVRIALKAKEYCKNKGIDDPRKLENSVVIPLIDNAKNIEDDNLSDMFAGLLTNHLDPNGFESVHPSFSKIISELSSIDARIIKSLYTILIADGLDYRKTGTGVDLSVQHFQFKKEVVMISYQNLWRLNICDHGGSLDYLNRAPKLFFTDFGWSMMKACMS